MSVPNNKYKLDCDEEASTPFLGKSRNASSTTSTSEEPTESESSKRKTSQRKRLLIVCFGTIFLVAVVVVCVVLTQEKDSLRRDKGTTSADRRLSLDDLISGKYSFELYEAEWVSDHTYLHNNEYDELGEYNVETGSTKTIMNPLELRGVTPPGYPDSVQQLSPDREWIIFANNTKMLYRHSFYADYFIKNLKTNEIEKLRVPNNDEEQIRYCGWSSVGNALVFVHKCNIYYVPSAEDHSKYYMITGNGVPKKVFNGVPDWVYEEEIISSTHAIEFSSDGRYMSYATFNATLVPFYRFPKYGPQDNMYPSIEKIAYPKAGFPNPTISITVVDLHLTIQPFTPRNPPRNHIIAPEDISQGDYYYAVMKFNGEDQLYIQWMNRAQNKTICMIYGMTDPNGYVVEEHQVDHGWVDDDYVIPMFAKDGAYYITMLARPVPGKGDFRHLAKITVTDPKVKNNIEFLTGGAFTITDIKCWNPDEQVLYFTSTEMSPRFRHVYSYNLTSTEKECVSCGLIRDTDGTNCTYHSVSFSTKCSWMILKCDGPFIPQTTLFALKNGKSVVLITNKSTREALKAKDLPEDIYYSIKSDGFDIPVKETRPKHFDTNRKYAVLFDVYGGPNHQKVTSQYNKVKFDNYFVTSFDCILVQFDARGSGNYGYNFLYAVYRNMGKYESTDAIAVAKYLQKKSYVDADRIAIWGWSYGGFFSATTLAMSGGVINTAVSVAPVTDWRYYDTVYSERYMGFPSKEDNLEGYERTSVMYKAKKFAGKNFLLIHGTADDNVHLQNSAQLVSALIRAGVKFRSQFYTDRDHSIRSGGHIFRLIADYLVEKLRLRPSFT